MKPTVMYTDSACRIGEWGEHFFVLWDDAPTPAHFRKLSHFASRRRRTEDPTLALHVVRADRLRAFAMSDDAREAAKGLIAEFEDLPGGTAYVIEGDGFLASAARAIITGLMLMRRPSQGRARRMFSSRVDAAKWLVSIPNAPPLSSTEFLEAFSTFVSASQDAEPSAA